MEFIGLIIFGFFVGAFGTSIGIGGGPLIVPFLLLVYRLPPTEIVATSLCVVFFNVISGSVAYYRQGRIDVVSGTKFGIATIPGAILGTYIPHLFSIRLLEMIFGVLLFILAVYVMVSAGSIPDESGAGKPRPAGSGTRGSNLAERTIIDAEGNKYTYSFNETLGMILSAKIGFVATMLGIGGGVIHVPMLTKALNFPVHIATATAHYKLFICSLFGMVSYIHMGYVNFGIAIPMAIGAVGGARLGAVLSKKLSGKRIFIYLAAALIILSVRLLFWPGR